MAILGERKRKDWRCVTVWMGRRVIEITGLHEVTQESFLVTIYLASRGSCGAGAQILVGSQAELLLEAGGEAAGRVVTAGEGGLQRAQSLLQQGEGVAHAHLGLGGLTQLAASHGANLLEAECQRRAYFKARLPLRGGLGVSQPLGGERAGHKKTGLHEAGFDIVLTEEQAA